MNPLMTTRNKGVLLNYATSCKKGALEKRVSQSKKQAVEKSRTNKTAPSLWHQWRESIKQADENGAPNKTS